MSSGVDAVVEQLEAGSREFFGVDAVTVTPDRHEPRPFSEVWRAQVAGPPVPFAIYIKVITPRAGGPSADLLRARLQRDFDISARIHRAMHGDPRLATVRPIAYFTSPLSMVTEEIPGVTFMHLLERRARRFRPVRTLAPDEAFEYLGAWVRRFQEIEGIASPRSLDELIEYIDIRLTRLVANRRAAFGSEDRQRVLAYLNCRRADVGQEDLADVAIHGDLSPANAMTDGIRAAVLDLSMIKRGTRLHDLARFYVQMELATSKPQIDPKVIAALQVRLLRGYERDLAADRPGFQVLLLMHRINHFESLLTRPERFPVNLYNAWVAARHRRWIHTTVTSP